MLLGIEPSVYAALRHAEVNSAFKIIAMGVEDGDHVHIALECGVNHSLASLASRIKSMSTAYLWQHEAAHLKKSYWSGKKMLWTGGYYVSTVGNVSFSKILDYVKNNGDFACLASNAATYRSR